MARPDQHGGHGAVMLLRDHLLHGGPSAGERLREPRRTAPRPHDGRDHGLAVQDALAGGYHLAWLVGACTVIVTLVVAVTMLRSGKSMECAVAPVECAAAA